jgi:hypothetical protein
LASTSSTTSRWIPTACRFSRSVALLDDPSPDVFAPGSNPYAGTRADVALACSVLPRIRINRIDYLKAEGPTVGRFVAQEMMDDQDFYLQIDTHSLFVGGWDVELDRHVAAWPTIPTPCSPPTRATRISCRSGRS